MHNMAIASTRTLGGDRGLSITRRCGRRPFAKQRKRLAAADPAAGVVLCYREEPPYLTEVAISANHCPFQLGYVRSIFGFNELARWLEPLRGL